ncbi:AAA-domain-containing protein [Microthyrium microscopicum]|uniref:AAA-domain-containing protein n=1 Tax=Microthyrium microscopicum TaxID=703497 RepID=A0A6A6U4I0_9PEZI|nr:AAA-domain-containing protein [Microthyrium microscopicum]
MTRGSPIAALQKTYDDTHLVCSTAIYFESRKEEAEALRCWKNALEQIHYHHAYRLPSNYTPKNETERALFTSIRQLELQCKERIDLLEALDASRKEAEGTEQADGETPGWLGGGTIPPLSVPDLARPPPLPSRPAAQRTVSSEMDIRATASSPLRSGRASRTPSPEKKARMKSTLRPLRQRRTASSTQSSPGLSRPPAAAKAATQAWITNPDVLSTPLESRQRRAQNEARLRDTTVLAGQAAMQRNRSPRVELEDEVDALDLDRDSLNANISRIRSEPEHAPQRLRPGRADRMKQNSANNVLGDESRPSPLSKSTSAVPVGTYRGSDPLRHSEAATASSSKTRPVRLRPDRQPYSSPSRGPQQNRRRSPVSLIKRKPVRSQPDPQNEDLLDDDDDEEADEESNNESIEPEADNSAIEELSWIETSANILTNLPRGVDFHAAEQILNEVIIKGDEVHWSDIAGLDIAKSALKENVVYPFLRPDLFRGLREPARGILLFGPPGTGKTMLARAVASESKSTFFAISASSLTSKFLGESEKLVRALFSLAKQLAPSVIFVDEIDSLLSARSDSGEHETSRRIKTEFLIQWSDLARAAAGREATGPNAGDASRVLVLAATNAPWAIDDAARRRFVRRQYIPLPEDEVRAAQLKTLLANQKQDLSEEDVAKLVGLTEGFSGSDITALTKDAAMGPLRSLGDRLLLTRSEDIRPISLLDFESSLLKIRPSVNKQGLQQFEDWATEYGERGG